jgi:hypothetical protein
LPFQKDNPKAQGSGHLSVLYILPVKERAFQKVYQQAASSITSFFV